MNRSTGMGPNRRPISRWRVWRSAFGDMGRWFAEESALVTTIKGKSSEVLRGWGHGPIDYVFQGGSHEYEDVRCELEALDSLMAEGGVIVVDDFHLGVVVYRLRSRLLNAIPGVIGRLLGRAWPRARSWSRCLSATNEYAIVRQRLSGVRNAVVEFVEEYGWPVVARDSLDAFARGLPGRRLFAGGAQQGDRGRQ